MTLDSRHIILIGCGHWGRNCARVLAGLGVLRGIVDSNLATARTAAELGCAQLTDVDQALADPATAAVVIATPDHTHADLALAALRHGKAVFIEKPLALSMAAGERIAAQAAACGRVVMVGHLLHYHNGFLALRDLLQKGSLGTLQHVSSSRLNFGRLRNHGNAMWALAPHDVSMLLALTGTLPSDVRAVGVQHVQAGIADSVTIHARFDGGATAELRASWISAYKEQRLSLVCDRGMAVFDDTKPWPEKLAIYRHGITWHGPVPHAHPAAPDFLPLEPAEPLRVELAHFVDCVARSQTPRTDVQEALNVLRVLEAAQTSLQRDGDLVRLVAQA